MPHPEIKTEYEPLFLRKFIREDPRMQSLPPHLKTRPEIDRGNHLFFEKIIRRSHPDIMNPVISHNVEEIQKAYRTYSKKSRFFISHANQIEGFRRIILYPIPLMSQDYSLNQNEIGFILVTDSGMVDFGYVERGESGEDKLDSVAEILEIILNDSRENWHIRKTKTIMFDLNPYSNLFQSMVMDSLSRMNNSFRSLGKDVYYQIKNTIIKTRRKRLNLACWAIRDALDPEILRIMRGTKMTKVQHAQWLTAGDEFNCGVINGDKHKEWLKGLAKSRSKISQSRIQAARAYPIMLYDFMNQNGDSPYFQKAIDDRIALAPLISQIYGTNKKAVKRIQGLTWQKAKIRPTNIRHEIQNILLMPKECFPSAHARISDIKIMRDYEFYLNGNFTNNLMTHITEDIEDRDREREKLFNFIYRLSKNGNPWIHIKRMRKMKAIDVKDSMEFLVEKLFMPSALHKIRDHAIQHGLIWDNRLSKILHDDVHDYIIQDELVLFKDHIKHHVIDMMGIKRLLDFCEHYHRNIIRYVEMFSAIDQSSQITSWSPFIGKVDFENGIQARELHSMNMLKTQGKKENHCVGGYFSSILDGVDSSILYKKGKARLIFSIEKKAGEILSTLEIGCRVLEKEDGPDKIVASIEQERAYQNSDPCEDALRLSKRIASHISDQPVESFHEYLKKLKISKKEYNDNSKTNIFLNQCGYDPWNRQSLETSWNELKTFLPAGIRRKGLDVFIENISIEHYQFREPASWGEKNIWELIKKE